MPPRRSRGEAGYALLAIAACSVTMAGMLGLTVDLGRIYIVRNEAQAYADAAALSAARELDGSFEGLRRAREAGAQSPNRWLLGTVAFTGTQTRFSAAPSGPWTAEPETAAGVRFVRVWATTNPPLYFLGIVAGSNRAQVNAAAVAGRRYTGSGYAVRLIE